jgi:hypothetical protein
MLGMANELVLTCEDHQPIFVRPVRGIGEKLLCGGGLGTEGHRLMVLTSEHQLIEFDARDGKLSDWSRRNPKAYLIKFDELVLTCEDHQPIFVRPVRGIGEKLLCGGGLIVRLVQTQSQGIPPRRVPRR